MPFLDSFLQSTLTALRLRGNIGTTIQKQAGEALFSLPTMFQREVSPPNVVASTSAPFMSSIRQTSKWPFFAASIKAVLEPKGRASGLALTARSCCTSSAFPFLTAIYMAVTLLVGASSMFKLRCKSNCTRSSYCLLTTLYRGGSKQRSGLFGSAPYFQSNFTLSVFPLHIA